MPEGSRSAVTPRRRLPRRRLRAIRPASGRRAGWS